MVKKESIKKGVKTAVKKPHVRRRYYIDGKFDAKGMDCKYDGYHGGKTAKINFFCNAEGSKLQIGDKNNCMIPGGTVKIPKGKIYIPRGKDATEKTKINPIDGDFCYLTEFTGKLTVDIPETPSGISNSIQVEVESFLDSIDAKSI